VVKKATVPIVNGLHFQLSPSPPATGTTTAAVTANTTAYRMPKRTRWSASLSKNPPLDSSLAVRTLKP
jgi:hypothetical protein